MFMPLQRFGYSWTPLLERLCRVEPAFCMKTVSTSVSAFGEVILEEAGR